MARENACRQARIIKIKVNLKLETFPSIDAGNYIQTFPAIDAGNLGSLYHNTRFPWLHHAHMMRHPPLMGRGKVSKGVGVAPQQGLVVVLGHGEGDLDVTRARASREQLEGSVYHSGSETLDAAQVQDRVSQRVQRHTQTVQQIVQVVGGVIEVVESVVVMRGHVLYSPKHVSHAQRQVKDHIERRQQHYRHSSAILSFVKVLKLAAVGHVGSRLETLTVLQNVQGYEAGGDDGEDREPVPDHGRDHVVVIVLLRDHQQAAVRVARVVHPRPLEPVHDGTGERLQEERHEETDDDTLARDTYLQGEQDTEGSCYTQDSDQGDALPGHDLPDVVPGVAEELVAEYCRTSVLQVTDSYRQLGKKMGLSYFIRYSYQTD